MAVAECLEQLDTVVELSSLKDSLRVADILKAQGDQLGFVGQRAKRRSATRQRLSTNPRRFPFSG